MALSFIGKPISLISHSDVRYRGILAGIDPAASTIQLSNVYSMGTETRRPPSDFIPPVQEPYQYIIFRASEVKDLAVDEPTPRRSVHDDPAVLGASAPMPAAYPPYPAPQGVAPPPVPQVPQPQVPPQQFNRLPPQHPQHPQHPQQQPPPVPQPVQPIHQQQPQQILPSQGPGHTSAAPLQQPQTQGRPQQGQGQGQNNNHNNNNTRRNNNSVHSAAVSLETVERAIGDLRVSTNVASMSVQNTTVPTTTTGATGGRAGRRGRGAHRGGEQPTADLQVPSTDFDFESSNAKFDKAALAASATSRANSTINGSNNGDEGAEVESSHDNDKKGNGARGGDQEKPAPVAYNPTKSFFDSLSSSTHPSISADAKEVNGASGNGGENGLNGGGNGGRGGRGRRGGGSAARSRREEERERNVATFGEPGGIGLMGPGAYVGGWGGYGGHGHGGHGRRGGRPRRGGAGGPPPGAAGAVPMRG